VLITKTSNECVRGIVSPAAASLHSCLKAPPSSLIRIFLPGDCRITNIAASNCTPGMLLDCQLWRGLGGQQRSREARKFASTHIGSVQQLLLPVARREAKYRDDEMTLDAMTLRAKFSADICEIRLAHERHRFRMLAPHAGNAISTSVLPTLKTLHLAEHEQS
jgi:hypothetical protein